MTWPVWMTDARNAGLVVCWLWLATTYVQALPEFWPEPGTLGPATWVAQLSVVCVTVVLPALAHAFVVWTWAAPYAYQE